MSSDPFYRSATRLDYWLASGVILGGIAMCLITIASVIPDVLLLQVPYSEFPATITAKDLDAGYINGANYYLSVKSDRLLNGGALVDVDEPTYAKAVVGENVCVKFKSAESVIKIRLFSFSKDVGLGGIGLAAKDIKVSGEGGC